MSRSAGLFITLEGGEGTGKSTQIKYLKTYCENQGHEVVLTREPGGTPEAEKIRDLLVQRDGGQWTPMAEVMLLYAARSLNYTNLIKPALEAGKIVISDRFSDSTRAYQGYGHGLPLDKIEEIDQAVLEGFKPDITFIMDLPVHTGLARSNETLKKDNSTEDRFEKLDTSFHEKLRQGYLAIAKSEPQRCVVIDASQSIEAVSALLTSHLEQYWESKAT